MTLSLSEQLLVLLCVATFLGIGIGAGIHGVLRRGPRESVSPETIERRDAHTDDAGSSGEASTPGASTSNELEALRLTLESEQRRRIDVQTAFESHLVERDGMQAHVRLQARRIALLEAELTAADERIARLQNRLGERAQRRSRTPEGGRDERPLLDERVASREESV